MRTLLLSLALLLANAAALAQIPTSSPQEFVRVYIVPMNDFPEQIAEDLARFLTEDLKFQVRSTLRLGDLGIQKLPGTEQLSADQILVQSAPTIRRFPEAGPKTYFLLLTGYDINTASRRTRFVFSWHSADFNSSVLSVVRLLEFQGNQPKVDSRFYDRLFKMSKRAIGELHLGWKRSNNPADVMYSPIMSLDDLDRLTLQHADEPK